MKEILERLRAAYDTLKARVDPHATEHEVHLLAAKVHDAAVDGLHELHKLYESAVARIGELEKKLSGGGQEVTGISTVPSEASACGPSAPLPQNTDPGNSEAPVVVPAANEPNKAP